MPLSILLNGQPRIFEVSASTLNALVTDLGLSPDRVALELNGQIIPRTRWPETPLSDGDKLELVQFVGGGSPQSPDNSVSHRSP